MLKLMDKKNNNTIYCSKVLFIVYNNNLEVLKYLYGTLLIFQELREDNAILTESKAMLEEHLSSSHKRIETVVELEKELMKYRQQIEEMSTVSV